MIVWDFSFLRNRAALKDWSDEKFETVLLEYKRFMEVVTSESDRNFGMAGDVDTIWHEHILHTRDYVSFCLKYAGHYIHHTPETPNEIDCSEKQESYKSTLGFLASKFGPVNHEVWPKLGALSDCSRCGGNCSSCKG